MSKITNIFHVAGNYIAEQHIDIHDNQQVVLGGLEDERVRGLGDERREEPADPKDILGIPHKGKYSEVRKYIEERKRFDEEFKTFCLNHSLRDLCTRLTKEFGWYVDENSLQRNLNRNR